MMSTLVLIAGVIIVVLIVLLVILGLVYWYRKPKKAPTPTPATPTPTPTPAPQPTPPASPTSAPKKSVWAVMWKWSLIIGGLCLVIWITYCVTMFKLFDDYRQKLRPVAVVTKPQATNPYPSVTLTRKDGWVPIRVYLGVGKRCDIKISPPDAVVTVKSPDGQIRKAGFGHERDSWQTKLQSNKEWQTHLISTNSETPVTYTVVYK